MQKLIWGHKSNLQALQVQSKKVLSWRKLQSNQNNLKIHQCLENSSSFIVKLHNIRKPFWKTMVKLRFLGKKKSEWERERKAYERLRSIFKLKLNDQKCLISRRVRIVFLDFLGFSIARNANVFLFFLLRSVFGRTGESYFQVLL